MSTTQRLGPHQGQPLLTAGSPVEDASGAVILIHGRGASAESILSLAEMFDRPDLAYLAPQAQGNTWYPLPFLAPIEQNEPFLTSALQVIEALLEQLQENGISPERTVLGGFSQGACLASEFTARNPRRYGGVFAFSGGVIGPDGGLREYEGSLENTPCFIGCSDVDPHIPLKRVHETTQVFQALQGDVTEKIYPGMAHTINRDEIAHVIAILDGLEAS